jgi:hypothetical protein
MLLLLLLLVLTSLDIITLEECQALLLSSNHLRRHLSLNSYSSPKNQRRILLNYSTATAEKASTTNQIIPITETNEQKSNNDINSNANNNNHHHRLTTATTNTLQEEVGAAFYQKLLELDNYIHLHGHCRVPKRYIPNPSLGNWVNKQRQQYKKYIASIGGGAVAGSSSGRRRDGKTSMNETRIKALNQRGFIWDATTTTTTSTQQQTTTTSSSSSSSSISSVYDDTAWQRMYNQLVQYYAIHGHCNVPSTSTLGQWVVRQRFHYRRQQKQSQSSSLTTAEHRIQLLNALNITWQTYNEQIWDKRITELQDFASLYGHVCVPRSYTANPTLGSWVATQRKYYNKYLSQQQQQQHGNGVLGERELDSSSKKITTNSKCPLTKERIKQLDEMGFVWSYWDYNFKNKIYE